MTISEIGVQSDGEEENVKLPSETLQISKPFTVSEDETTSFVYDITVVKAGQSGQYILKPQIADNGADQEFEEVKAEDKGDEKPETPGKPEVLEFEGTIQEIVDEDTWTVEIEGSGNRTVNVSEAEIDGDPAVRAAPLV